MNPNERTLTRIIAAWNYEDVGSVSAFIEDKSLRDVIMCRQVKFLKTMSL